MVEIGLILDQYKPVYHFFGHTGEPFRRQLDANRVTVCAKLSDCEWDESDRGSRLKADCFGVLRWRNPGDHQFDVVAAPWLKEYPAHTWKWL